MVPKGWSIKPVSEILEKVSRPVSVNPIETYCEIGIRSHGKGIFYKEPIQGQELGNKRVFHIEPECLIVNIVFAWEQAVAKTTTNEIGMIASHRFPMFRPKSERCDIDYIVYSLKTSKGKYLLELASPGGAGRNKTLGQSEFSQLEFLLPPIREQVKIAKILSTWDEAIAAAEQLLTNSQQQKKALMQQLLTGKKRLLNDNGVKFSGEFKRVELGSVFEKISNGVAYDASNSDGLPVTRIETISTGKVNFEKVGWAPDDENTKRFKLERGDVLYSHINSLEHIGRVAYFNDNRPLYHGMNLLLLRAKKEYDSLFFYHLLNSQVGKKYAKSYAKSAVNQASISTTDIKTFKVYIPDSEEQQKIAAVLSAADHEITALQQKLDALKQEKKALMQQLLSGKRRVKVEVAA